VGSSSQQRGPAPDGSKTALTVVLAQSRRLYLGQVSTHKYAFVRAPVLSGKVYTALPVLEVQKADKGVTLIRNVMRIPYPVPPYRQEEGMDQAMEDMTRAASWGSALLPDKWSLQSGVHGLCALFVSARQIQRGKESPNREARQYGAPSLLLAQMFDGPRARETLARRQAHMKTGALLVCMEQSVPTLKSHVR